MKPFRRRPTSRRPVHLRRAGKSLRWLERAHQLFESGEFEQSGEIYFRLAHRARQRRIHQAPILMLQAAKAQLAMGEVDHSLQSTETALGWLEEDQRWAALFNLSQRAVAAFQNAGLPKKAEHLEPYLEIAVSELQVLPSQPIHHAPAFTVPEKCTYCGGTLTPDLTEVLKNGDILCAYCGSRITPGSQR